MKNKVSEFFYYFDKITSYYEFLVKRTKNKEYVGISDEWIIDNYYLLVEHKNNIIINAGYLKTLMNKCSVLYGLLLRISEDNNYSINLKNIYKELNKFQKKENYIFTYKEIEAIPTILTFIFTKKVYYICDSERIRYTEKKIIQEVFDNKDVKNIVLEDFSKRGIKINNNSYFVCELNNILKEYGTKGEKLFKELNGLLINANQVLKKVLNDEYQRKLDVGIVIGPLFANLKSFFDYDREDLFENVSLAEKTLLTDDVYHKMTPESKDLYRNQIIRKAKKQKINEYQYIFGMMKKANYDHKHIGEIIIHNKPSNKRMFSYEISIMFFTLLITFILANYFIKPYVVGVLILLIPVEQIVVQIINSIIIKRFPPKYLPKMDYSKGIPVEDSTMVVIPTIISNTKKIDELYESLETFYITNKSKNLYFTLLGDAKAEKVKDTSYDKDVIKYGLKMVEKLNKKYHGEIFHFAYRKRVWNEAENCYLGYERKRGALLHFNKLLLGKFSKNDQNKYYQVHTFDNFKTKIKYIITLDADTKLVFNSALSLVGAMAHPLNKPVLNKENSKVIKGYGLMSPRLSVDIESTNKSLYSQIFADIGGFDSYGAIIPNFYQDVFNEGTFYGKGIYDLAVFDKLLSSRFPDNLILSHDLLEGNYVRCANVTDIELVDDFPSRFNVDLSRQSRWARGDTQIIGWLRHFVKNKQGKKVKNPIDLIGQHKIADNVLRLFWFPATLLVILLSQLFCIISPYWWLIFIVIQIGLPLLLFLKSKLYIKKPGFTNVYHKNLLFGGKSTALRTLIVFATIPLYAKTYLESFIKSIYRMTISHKNLLNWVTAEDAAKTNKNTLKSYIRLFLPNYVVSALILFYIIFVSPTVLGFFTMLTFMSAPFILYLVSQDIDENEIDITIKEEELVTILASRTWQYFKDTLTVENHYLVPDNYQDNREQQFVNRTSSTNIGYSLTAVVSACELGFITFEEAYSYINNIIKTVKTLEKWNGHLYNWYEIDTKKVIQPYFVSTADSGNFVAGLIVAKEFLKKNGKISESDDLRKMVVETDFSKLFTKQNVFSIGFDESEAKLDNYNYNKFASESRLSSYIAISKGDIPSKHWNCLDKSLTVYKKEKGLLSWSGSCFEYFMPLMYMKHFPNTLLDESYKFALYCQKEFIKEIDRKLPWGMSESAFYELDNSQNYKYATFGVPYLKAKEDRNTRIVVSPYSSIMAIEIDQDEVIDNIKKFVKLNMVSDYGMYDAYDYDNKTPVKTYFAHHEGMILASLANYLKDDCVKDYFNSDIYNRTYELLLKEKVQLKTSIDLKMAKYKKYDYDKNLIDNFIRTYTYVSDMPQVSVLSNKKYMVLMNDRGSSFSRYRTIQLNRYRKVTELDYGLFLYIKDLHSKRTWSNTYAPLNIKPEKYEVVFANDRIKYLRKDGKIFTKTEIIVTKDHHAEIRKVTFSNSSNKACELELTTYCEPTICENQDDVSHRVFNNMSLSSEYDKKNKILITKRKTRKDDKINSMVVNKLLINNPLEEYQYETDRINFLGRNHDMSNPVGLNKKLSNKAGTNVEPCMSIRNVITVDAYSSESVYIINGFGRSKEQLLDIIKSYSTEEDIEKAFKISTLMSAIYTKDLNITGEEMRMYNIMLNFLYQTTKISVNEERTKYLKNNALSQKRLWKFGVSGDRPIIMINIHDIKDITFVKEIIKAFEYYKNSSIFVDIIIINSENDEYADVIKREIDIELYRMYSTNNFHHTPGLVTLINQHNIDDDEMKLLNIVPRLKFDTNINNSLRDSIDYLQSTNHINKQKKPLQDLTIYKSKKIDNITMNNTYGGFINNGSEYVITDKDTPLPWSNVIANENFGTVITNNGCGFTYGYSAGEFKISSWSNDVVSNDKSEGLIINNNIFEPTTCIHGKGYSILLSETKDFKLELKEFVALRDNVKIYLLKINNKNRDSIDTNLDFWINPTLGNFEEKTGRHILAETMGNENYMNMRNVYSITYSDINVFMSSSEKIEAYYTNKIMTKSINVAIKLKSNEEKEIVFTLGCERDKELLINNVKFYNNVYNATKELEKVKNYWNETLGTINVNTPDDALNYMLNGWYLYQTLSSRIMARTGFYQVSGAFGYRDQLQDSMNVVYIKPDMTRRQIIKNASHQFETGDVLHWWHDINRFGLRSRYKDDYLWLALATSEYIEATGDYSILDEMAPFVVGNDLAPSESERGMEFTFTPYSKTILNHIILSINYSMEQLGIHGIPLMGGGDWNDGMNKVGIGGKGESVWLGFFLYDVIKKFIKMMEYDSKFNVDKYIKFNAKLKNNLNKHAWDKDYYLRAFFDNGHKLGSIENTECKIDLISQSYAILSDVITNDRIDKVINSVSKYLVDKDNGIIKLLTPAFALSKDNPGYIMNYPKGIRENGGQYTHATAWYIMALTKLNKNDEAYDYYQMINPINHSLTKIEANKYKVEPYVIAADIYSEGDYAGRGGWTWYTGSAGWYYKVGIKELLGFVKKGDILEIHPHVPSNWQSYSINYQYMDTRYEIMIKMSVEDEIIVDKKSEKTIKLVNDKKVHKVIVNIKR